MGSGFDDILERWPMLGLHCFNLVDLIVGRLLAFTQIGDIKWYKQMKHDEVIISVFDSLWSTTSRNIKDIIWTTACINWWVVEPRLILPSNPTQHVGAENCCQSADWDFSCASKSHVKSDSSVSENVGYRIHIKFVWVGKSMIYIDKPSILRTPYVEEYTTHCTINCIVLLQWAPISNELQNIHTRTFRRILPLQW